MPMLTGTQATGYYTKYYYDQVEDRQQESILVEDKLCKNPILLESRLTETTTVMATNGGDERIASPQKSRKNFARFSELPTEIRIKIWKVVVMYYRLEVAVQDA